MRKSIINERTLEEILNSDDELSTEFNEASYVPAYQDDSRFEYLEKKRQSKIPLKEVNLNKAIFNKNDAFCIQSIQKIPDDTLLWFFKFLLLKDLQSNYKFLKSCLVPSYEYNFSKETNVSSSSMETKLNGSYKIIVNK